MNLTLGAKKTHRNEVNLFERIQRGTLTDMFDRYVSKDLLKTMKQWTAVNNELEEI